MSIGAQPSFSAMSTYPGGFANGLVVQGMPILNTYPGRVFWLDSTNGSDSNRGTYARPFATLMGAQAAMISPAPTVWKDLLMVKPWHRETITAPRTLVTTTGSMSLDLSGMTIIGLGSGQDRPLFTLSTANTATINVTGSQITVANCRFRGNFLNVAALFTLGGSTAATGSVTASTSSISGTVMTATGVTGYFYPGSTLHSTTSGFVPGTKIVSQLTGTTGGAGTYAVNISQTVASGTITTVCRDFNLVNCDVTDTSAILNILGIVKGAVTSNSCDGLVIASNTISATHASAACYLLTTVGTHDRVSVVNNYYSALTTDTGPAIVVSAGKVLTNAQIRQNTILLTGATTTTTGILLTTNGSTNTGVVADNYVASLDVTSPLMLTASSGFDIFNNYYPTTTDKSGALLPATS